MKTLSTTFILAWVIALAGCGGDDEVDLSDMVASTLESEPLAADFARLYPDATHGIIYSDDGETPPQWWSRVTINNQYAMVMEFEIEVDLDAQTAKRVGKPLFMVSTVPKPVDGNQQAKYAEFGEDEWAKIVAANGSLAPVRGLLK